MIRGNTALIATLALVSSLPSSASEPADTHHFPRIGQCYSTRIAAVAYRLLDAANSGTALQFINGH